MGSTDYASLKVAELKKLLQERGLAQNGVKAELVARLTEDDASKAASAPAAAAPAAAPKSAGNKAGAKPGTY